MERNREIKVNGSKIWYIRKVNRRNDVGIIADKEWRKNVVGVKRDCRLNHICEIHCGKGYTEHY